MSFGRYLLRQGVLGREQLNEYAHVMVVFGGRLGTVLAEAGRLGLEDVEAHLARYLGVPPVPLELAHAPAPEALAAISPDLAQRHAALPLRFEKQVLHVAMLDPTDPHDLEQIAFSAGATVEGYAIAERRLVELLERFYGIRQDPRFTDGRVLAIAGHAPVLEEEVAPVAGLVPDRTSAWSEQGEALSTREALGIRGDAEASDSADAFEWQRGSRSGVTAPADRVDASSAGSGRPRDPAALVALEAGLSQVANRDALATLVLEIAQHFVRRAALFVVRDESIRGLGATPTIAPGTGELTLPALSDGLLARAAREGARWRDVPAQSGSDRRLLLALGGECPPEAAVLPIRIAGRSVNLLYVDNESEVLAETSLAALEALCGAAAAAYERLILERKRLHC